MTKEKNSDWHAFRAKGIGSSDAAVILGLSPWKTFYELWEEKCGIHTIEQSNWATQKGQEMEPIARARYELKSGLEFPEKLFIHPELDFIRASLDGFNEETRTALEIKCPGKEDHETAKSGQVPKKYYGQVQHLILASQATRCDYYSYKDGEGVCISVAPDPKHLEDYIIKAKNFWDLVQSRTPPELSEKDFKIGKDPELLKAVADWRLSKLNADIAITHEETEKKRMLSFVTHARMKIGEVTIQKTNRVGSVNYKSIPELKGVDLEKFRGKPSESWRCTIGRVEIEAI